MRSSSAHDLRIVRGGRVAGEQIRSTALPSLPWSVSGLAGLNPGKRPVAAMMAPTGAPYAGEQAWAGLRLSPCAQAANARIPELDVGICCFSLVAFYIPGICGPCCALALRRMRLFFL
jgi:hypothetical protein